MKKLQFEPFWWSLFGAGGAISAIFLPILLLIFGLAVPLGWIEAPSYSNLVRWVEPVISRLIFFVIIALSMFHWAHRFRFTLEEGLQLQHWDRPIAIVCYGIAILLTMFAGYTLWTF